jgi:hypothetical protein
MTLVEATIHYNFRETETKLNPCRICFVGDRADDFAKAWRRCRECKLTSEVTVKRFCNDILKLDLDYFASKRIKGKMKQ